MGLWKDNYKGVSKLPTSKKNNSHKNYSSNNDLINNTSKASSTSASVEVATMIIGMVNNALEFGTAITNYFLEREKTKQAEFYYKSVVEECRVEREKIKAQYKIITKMLKEREKSRKEYLKIVNEMKKSLDEMYSDVKKYISDESISDTKVIKFLEVYEKAVFGYSEVVKAFANGKYLNENELIEFESKVFVNNLDNQEE